MPDEQKPGNTPDDDKLNPEDVYDPNKPEARDTTEEDEAHKKHMEELFGDLDEDDNGNKKVDTIESLRAERDELLLKLAGSAATLAKSQSDNLTLTKRLDEAKQLITRTEAKAEDDKKFAIEGFIKQALPVIDTLELGLASIDKKHRAEDPKFAKLAEGVEKTLSQLTAVFNKFGVKAINPINEPFDAEKHEAIMTQPKEGCDPETVVTVCQKGYEINGRVIRHAKVIVTPPDC
ncbi:MAG: nucleotide exchange factor GrpE [Alphaproteobacteria bacterium]|nr:MAG: nucleotide exchange factor GrpE [Alphaproteobacteria bacterium]